jgi:hypothetical protein
MVVGPAGPPGPAGPATVNVGTTTTSEPGTDAAVSNAGDGVNAVFDFVIPRGDVGPPGASITEVASVADLPAGQAPGTVFLTLDTGDLYRADGTKATGWQRISDRVTSTQITDSTVVGRAVVTAPDAGSARDVLDVYSREQTVSPGDQLPNECGFWYVSEPVSVGGKLFMGTVAEDLGSWVQEWTQPVDGGPFYLHRYFMGYAEIQRFDGDASPGQGEGFRDDHNPAAFAIKAGKPMFVAWSGHGSNSRIYYRISDQNVDEARPGELTFGPVQVHAVADDERTSYPTVMYHNDDIWVAHRTGYTVNKWSLTKFPEWGTGTPVQYDLVFTAHDFTVSPPQRLNQLYFKGRIFDGVMRCQVSNGPFFSVHRTTWWCEVNLTTGSVTKSDGTVLGNLFTGTNVPLEASVSLEAAHISPTGKGPLLFDVGYGSAKEMLFCEGTLSNFPSDATYKHARWTGNSWSVNTITTVNQPQGQLGSYYPIVNFVPGEPNAVLLTRAEPATATTGIHKVEKWTTSDSGATWARAATVDSAPYDSTGAGDRRGLARAFPVRVESGSAISEAVVADVLEFPRYDYGWVINTRPAPTSAILKRVPPDDPIRNAVEATTPGNGLYLPGLDKHWIKGPTTALPASGVRVEIDVALPNWIPGTEISLLGKEKDADNREFRLVVGAVGRIGVYWSENGSTAKSLIPDQILGFRPGQRVQIAAEFIPSHSGDPNQSSNPSSPQLTLRVYYRLNDFQPWKAFVVAQNSPATSLFLSDSPWEIGSRRLGVTDQAVGVFYRASIMTIGGSLIAEWRADKLSDQGVQVDPLGNTWTVNSRDRLIDSPVITNLKSSSILDPANNRLVSRFESTATESVYRWLTFRSSNTTPTILADGGAANDNIAVQIIAKNNGPVRILSSGTPELQGWGGSTGNSNFNITTQSTGVVQINGTQVEVKGHTHTVAQVTGAAQWITTPPASATAPGTAGQLCHSDGFLYICVATNTWVWSKTNKTWPPA